MKPKFYASATKSVLNNPHGKFTQHYNFKTREGFVEFCLKHHGTLSKNWDGTGEQIVPHTPMIWATGDGKIGYSFRIY